MFCVAVLVYVILIAPVITLSSCANQCTIKPKFKKHQEVYFKMADTTSRGIIIYVSEPSINNNCEILYTVGYFSKVGIKEVSWFNEQELIAK